MFISKIGKVLILAVFWFPSAAAEGAAESFSMPALAEIEVQAEIAKSRQTKYLNWYGRYLVVLRALVSGRIDEFHDRLIKLEGDDQSFSGESQAERMSLLYSRAVDAGVEVSPALFEKALNNWWARRTMFDPDGGAVDPRRHRDRSRRFHANLAFLRRDIQALKDLDARAPGDPHVAYLIAVLDQSSAALLHASELLQASLDGVTRGDRADSQMGWIALAAGRTMLMLSRGDPTGQHLDLAEKFAFVARSNLELMDTPVMFGRAMELTSELYSERARREDDQDATGRRARALLEARSEQAYNVAIQYQ